MYDVCRMGGSMKMKEAEEERRTKKEGTIQTCTTKK
jgi:hypothetical protein